MQHPPPHSPRSPWSISFPSKYDFAINYIPLLAAKINYCSSAKTNYELVNEKVCLADIQSGQFRLFGRAMRFCVQLKCWMFDVLLRRGNLCGALRKFSIFNGFDSNHAVCHLRLITLTTARVIGMCWKTKILILFPEQGVGRGMNRALMLFSLVLLQWNLINYSI